MSLTHNSKNMSKIITIVYPTKFHILGYYCLLISCQLSTIAQSSTTLQNLRALQTTSLRRGNYVLIKNFFSKVKEFMTFMGNQFRSANFKFFVVIILFVIMALLCVITSCSAKYFIFIICFAILLLTSLTDARPIEKMDVYENTAANLHVNHFDCSKMISKLIYSLYKEAPCKVSLDKISTN